MNLRARTAGYTLDQTILIVAIIAILITLIILTVGWEILTRAGGTKVAAQLRQVEDAIGGFYSEIGMWPHQAMSTTGAAGDAGSPRLLAAALSEVGALGTGGGTSGQTVRDRHRNFITGMKLENATDRSTMVLVHGIGAGGDVRINRVNLSGNSGNAVTRSIVNGNYYVVEFNDIPQSEAQRAKEQIDGEDFIGDAAETRNGRVTFRTAATGFQCSNATQLDWATFDAAAIVDVCYVANLAN